MIRQSPPSAERVLRDPVERVCSLRDERREELEEQGWSLADVYLRLGGGGPRSSELHERFGDFFNGQARDALAGGPNQAKLEFWAGIPDRGAALRDEALAALAGQGTGAEGRRAAGPADPETRALILAHNQIDVELHAHFLAAAERRHGHSPERTVRPSRRSGAVCVLGAPRSGTSLTTRILNVLGVDLGPEEELMPAMVGNNRTGFWEHEGIADLNEEILASLSEEPPPYLQGWRWPPPLAEGWQRGAELEPHRRGARAMLRGSFGEGGLWGWKDPRTSLTLPFWQELVAEMRYVICLRHPLDVAASLAARDQMSTEESLQLWLRYMGDAMRYTRGLPRLIVAYESYFPEWEGQAQRLAELLGLTGIGEEQRDAIAAHIDGSLWHQREAREGGAALPRECASLYAELTELAQA